MDEREVPLTDEFRRRIVDVHGAEGEAWLRALPSLLSACEARWGLRLLSPFPCSYNYVARAERDNGARVVLKAGIWPDLRHEIAALRHFGGHGAVRLLDADEDAGVLLLERIEPGTMLVALEDDARATEIAAGVMRELWRPPDGSYPFPTVDEWAGAFVAAPPDALGPLPAALVAKASALFAELLLSSGEHVVLHGDLHHENILDGGGGRWVAIDPHGVLGEREYETAALLRNPTPQIASWPDLPAVLARRVDQLTDALGFDRQRIIAWGIAHAVLSAFWSYEGHGDGWQPAIAVAEVLDGLR